MASRGLKIRLKHWVSRSRGTRMITILTHWGRDKMAAVSQTTLPNAFSWTKMLEIRLRFHWSLFLMVQLTIIQHRFRYWLGAGQAASHYLNQWWLVYWRIYASLGLNELNLKKRLKNTKNTLAMWICRNLSLEGKVTVINTLAISPLLYLANTTHVPPQEITEVKQIVVDFIWDGKPSIRSHIMFPYKV